MREKWISKNHAVEGAPDLLQLYAIYQDRQKCDLDMHLRFANWYSAILVALTTAFLVAIIQFSNKSWACMLIILPLVAILLIYQARLAVLRFYRRYTEGRVRLTKIERLLGLDGPICQPLAPSGDWTGKDLWPADTGFLPDRYYEQSYEFLGSNYFVRARSLQYGIGRITDRTMVIFLMLSWLFLVSVPISLAIWQGSWPSLLLNPLFLITAVTIGCLQYCRFRQDVRQILGETPGLVVGIDFDGTLADTRMAKQAWLLSEHELNVDLNETNQAKVIPLIGKEEHDRMILEVCGRESTQNVNPVPGALEAIERIKQVN